MLRCGCGMMIECEVKTGQTVESIEHTRREGGDGVGMKLNERRNLLMKRKMNISEKGGLMNGKEREVSLLRFENSPDGRETRRLFSNDDRM